MNCIVVWPTLYVLRWLLSFRNEVNSAIIVIGNLSVKMVPHLEA